jgi:hypothetical protein
MVVSLSPLRAGRTLPQTHFLVTISLEAESTAEPQCGWKVYVNRKKTNPVILSGIEPVSLLLSLVRLFMAENAL